MKNQLLIYIISLILISCNESKKEIKVPLNPKKTEKYSNKYRLSSFTESPSFKEAKLENMTFIDGSFNFEVTNYELGVQTKDAERKMCANSGKGQHIHLIVDDLPYAAKYVKEFKHKVKDGNHNILAFLSRSYHESIKTKNAHIALNVDVIDQNITASTPIKEPMIFYSRPKGTYVGKDTEKVMLDYYLVNVPDDAAYKVEAAINGEKHIFDSWAPRYIEGLKYGENKISLTLKDNDGNIIQNGINPVTRVFTLKEDVLEEK